MNKVNLIGRWCKDPDVRYLQNENNTCVARCTLAVDRKFKKDGEQQADFINCVAFGKVGELIEKYTSKGVKIGASGRLQSGKYTNKDGVEVYTTDLIIEEIDFLENKRDGGENQQERPALSQDGFINIPDGIDEELPFN